MKKQSFFERLAGNLRFNDTNEDMDVEAVPERPTLARRPTVHTEQEHRDLSLNAPPVKQSTHTIEHAAPIEEEEVGELPVDMYETGHEIIIQTLIAGVLPEHLSIGITRDVVTISGKREATKGVDEDQYQLQELYWGSFARTVELPEEIEIDGAEAIERHGMLMIKLPKLDKRRKAILKIKSI